MPTIEPEGGREKATAIFEGTKAERFARRLSEARAGKLVNRQIHAVMAQPDRAVYHDFYARQGLELRVESVAAEWEGRVGSGAGVVTEWESADVGLRVAVGPERRE